MNSMFDRHIVCQNECSWPVLFEIIKELSLQELIRIPSLIRFPAYPPIKDVFAYLPFRIRVRDNALTTILYSPFAIRLTSWAVAVPSQYLASHRIGLIGSAPPIRFSDKMLLLFPYFPVLFDSKIRRQSAPGK